MKTTPSSRNDPSDIIHITARRHGTNAAVIALWDREDAYVSEAIVLRARLVQHLDDLRAQLATHYSFDEPGAGNLADRIAAVALAIEELDALVREDDSIASGERLARPADLTHERNTRA